MADVGCWGRHPFFLSLKNVGTGIMRALELESGMTMVNDVELQEFVVTFRREWNGEGDGRAERSSLLRTGSMTIT